VCGRTGVKLLYPRSVAGRQQNVCKVCRNKKATKQDARAAVLEPRERAAGDRL
jgi:hypothetical protein